ncbi:hypothetical protein EDB85DRAFT_1975489 [Lactarius pseudohatsudake]|nr:hypothetical protein EDB85DRAFT_1975489 [Lactarius pseudohatsudake]
MTTGREILRDSFSSCVGIYCLGNDEPAQTPTPISFRFRFGAMLRCLRERKQTPAEANSEALSFEGAPNNTRASMVALRREFGGGCTIHGLVVLRACLRELLLGVFWGRASREKSKHRHGQQAVHTLMPSHTVSRRFSRVVPDHGHPRSKVTYLWNMLVTGKLNDPFPSTQGHDD